MHDGRSDGRAEIKQCYVGVDGRRRIAEREDKFFFALFARSSATPCRLFRVHRDRATRISVPRTPWVATVQTASSHSFAVRAFFLTCRALISRALRAHVRHFSFFAFTASPLCRKPLSDSRFGVKAFPKMLHRSEASSPHPPSGCNRPRRARPTRLGWGTRITKSPLQNTEKAGATAPKSPSGAVKARVKGFSAKPSPLTA